MSGNTHKVIGKVSPGIDIKDGYDFPNEFADNLGRNTVAKAVLKSIECVCAILVDIRRELQKQNQGFQSNSLAPPTR
jgi:hypothetical protein